MKIVLFTPGLGNQIFQYCFCLYLRDKYHENIYGYYNKEMLNKHNGLEVHKVFDIILPQSTNLSNSLAIMARTFNKFGIGYFKSKNTPQKDCLYYDGFWQHFYLIQDYVGDLKFREEIPSSQNKEVLDIINKSNSVSVHIRRGDYLDPIRIKQFGQSCPEEYYRKSIDYFKQKYNNPVFVFFSDDMDWVKKNLKLEGAIYVDWNNGNKSSWDMRLMSNCKSSIIANSTFSYWGAMLGKEKEYVIKPLRWIGNEIPDIFPNHWISF